MFKHENKLIKYPITYEGRYRKGDKKMTLIIGARFKDGVILVSDRKVTNEETGIPEYENKLQMPYNNPPPIIFGAAGYSHKFKQFNRKIIELVEQRIRELNLNNMAYLKELGLKYPIEQAKLKPKKLSNKDIESQIDTQKIKKTETDIVPPYIYSIENFIEDCQQVISELCTGRDGLNRPDLDVLLILFAGKPRLHRIDFLGEEQELNYCAIGSGSQHINIFLKQFWKQDMTIEEILALAYFCIYYVQDLDLDSGVGTEEGILPDHSVVVNDGNFGQYNGLAGREEQIIEEARNKVKRFKSAIGSMSFSSLISSQ